MNSSLKTQLVIAEDDSRFVSMRQLGSYRSDRYSSKLWILPDGSIHSIDQWHYCWILGNGPLLARYGLNMDELPDDEGPVRVAAIQAGLFRGNYLIRDGSLVIEGLKNRFNSAIKEAIKLLIMSNNTQIGSLSLTLFDDRVTMCVFQTLARWAQLNESEKLSALEGLIDL